MKLARPDVRHPRIALAGAGADAGEDAGLIAALRTRGLHARWMRWDDPATLDADLVILRAAADIPDRLDDFLAWTRQVRNLLNAPEVVAWNAAPRYLGELQRAGVPTAVRGDTTALVFFGGAPSHAFAAHRQAEPDFEAWELGQAAVQAAADHVGVDADEFLYARADVTGGPDDVRLVALDLVAPSLGWRALGDAARGEHQRQFALCVESALQRLGLGPLSHRRP